MGDGYGWQLVNCHWIVFCALPPESASRGTQMNQVVLKLVVT